MISNLKSVEENQEYLKSIIGVDGRGYIDWKNSVGKEIRCEYYWNKGRECSKKILKINKYKNSYVYFEGYEKRIRTSSLTECALGGVLGFKTSEFKYEIGDTVNYLIVTDRDYKTDKKIKYYKYKCNKCGNEDWIAEYHLKEGQRCNVCCDSPRKAVFGINTIWDVAKWMVDLMGVSEKDAKTHTPSSNDEVYVKCPYCKRIKKTTLNTIYNRHSIGCSCSDGVSFPEKVIENLLIQLGVKYKHQYIPNWSENKIYDFYLTDYNTIIETHGGQHYEECTRGRSLKEEQENDRLKEELAFKNGINYIVIDCRESTLDWIKDNILKSKLNNLFDLDNIDWNKCEEYALKNKVKEVCDYYKGHAGISTDDLAKEFGISRVTIIRYLNNGAKLNWCEYEPKKEMERGLKLGRVSKKKSVLQITTDGIKEYESITEASKQTEINFRCISNCCRGKQKTAGGYVWRFAE